MIIFINSRLFLFIASYNWKYPTHPILGNHAPSPPLLVPYCCNPHPRHHLGPRPIHRITHLINRQIFNLPLSISTTFALPPSPFSTAVGTGVVADTLPAADNHPHQAAGEDTPPAAVAGTVPVRPGGPDGPAHHASYFHPAVRHTTDRKSVV